MFQLLKIGDQIGILQIQFPSTKLQGSELMEEASLEDLIKKQPVKDRIPLLALRKLATDRERIDDEQQQSITRIKLSYQQKLQPLLARASEIIRGGAILEDELKAAPEYLRPNQSLKNHMKGKVIEGYWNGVLSNSPLVDEVNENDEKALNYLLDIQVVFPEGEKDKDNVTLKFVFKENPYFKETEVVRRLIVKNGQALALEGDQVSWKEGKCLTHEVKKVTNKKTGESRIEKGKKVSSFFDLFQDQSIEDPAQLQKARVSMNELGNLIVVDSLDYFLGLINCEENSEFDEDDEEEDDDEDEQTGHKKGKQN